MIHCVTQVNLISFIIQLFLVVIFTFHFCFSTTPPGLLLCDVLTTHLSTTDNTQKIIILPCVEDRYELILSRHCHCRLFLASENTATTTCRKVLAHRVARGLARADLSKRAARMARTACMWPCSAHAQMPL